MERGTKIQGIFATNAARSSSGTYKELAENFEQDSLITNSK